MDSVHLMYIIIWFGSRDKYRVVGFVVEPMSVDHSEIKFQGDTCNYPDTPKPQIVIKLTFSHFHQIFQ